ncbi:MAG: 16S rRNA (guanine(966)-N(2))-methyltransferase RsmD [Deltaproteobacteria bacterium]|nr:16S rRNA (guanine(966)-N(2))-methyltransferase RsmD [Deltaproteobacteria bacterium]
MRVVAGKWRGRPLRAPRGESVRPTTGMVREAVFGILGARVEGARVLDLFAGTGAMAIEALSRGAAEAVLVESSRKAVTILKGNLDSVGVSPGTVMAMDYRAALRKLAARGAKFSLVFVDPPYGKGIVGESAAELARHGVLSAGAVVAAERAARDPLDRMPGGWELLTDRKYGDTRVTLYEVAGTSGDPS